MRTFHVVPILALALIAACSEPTATSDQKPPAGKGDDAIVVLPASAVEIFGQADADVPILPSVRVYTSSKRAPVAGIAVTFRITPPGGETTTLSSTTDVNGIATMPAWRLGSTVGSYVAVASVAGSNSVEFTVYVRGRVVAIYDLIAFENAPLPSPWVSEGHYVLYENGTYNQVYNRAVDALTPFNVADGTYRSDREGGFRFYSTPAKADFFTAMNGFLFATATPYGSNLRFSYSDFIDYEVEIYALR